ncbi:MAG TPA: serine/threonine-protein kinase [Gemmataceae bacterium]|jgi:serine/threonine protein kinase|nr:serine/threonine-protein kinase [Gemmataceae bacterium]
MSGFRLQRRQHATDTETVASVHVLETPIAAPDAAGPLPVDRALGSNFGKYELIAFLGRGSTSVVFEGRHRKLQIPVAVKVLHRDALANAPNLLGQLVSEAVLLAKLNHPNVVRLWDLDDEGPTPYLVLEYVRGTTLAELVNRPQPIPVAFAFAVIRQAVEGLAEAHKLGIVHRDVKPGNLLIGPDGVVKVADLGLAMMVGDRLTRQAAGPADAVPAGTAAYLAPEQALNPRTVDFRADIYSIGATIYHALTGRMPFEGRSAAQVILKHLHEPPVPPRDHNPEVTEEQSDVVLRMMAKDPGDRFASYDDVRQALARAVGDRRAPMPLAKSFLTFAAPKNS